jgi:tetratricopeptide (TPR) repeat protein
MEIKNKKSETDDFVNVLALCLAFLALVSFCIADDYEPLDVLDANFVFAVDMNTVPLDFLSIAQANLLAKMDGSSDLQSQLKSVIERINTIQFKSKQQAESDAAIKSDIETAQKAAEKTQAAQTTEKTIVPDAQAAQGVQTSMTITEQTAQMLEQSIQQPQNVKNPLELAELLYNCGRLKEAAVFYQQALSDSNQAGDVMYKDKAWLLFQAGNCLQKIEPEKAVKLYKRLVIEYPDSIWAEPAVSKSHLIEWYLQQKPETLLKKAK